jgi:hypothetical protein
MPDLKTCRTCGQDKPLDGYYTHPSTGDGLDPRCKTCLNARPKSAHTVASRRARQRATQDLLDAHPDEFQRLYQLRLSEALFEVQQLARLAPPEAPGAAMVTPLLTTGRRTKGQSVVDRIREQCAECATYHERGHECPVCAERDRRKAGMTTGMTTGRASGHAHGDPRRAQAVELLRAGRTPGQVAAAVGMTETWAMSLLALLRKDGAA